MSLPIRIILEIYFFLSFKSHIFSRELKLIKMIILLLKRQLHTEDSNGEISLRKLHWKHMPS